MPEIRPNWKYGLLNVSADMRGPRTSVARGQASRLVGVDGNREGGLRPSAGFKYLDDLLFGYSNDTDMTNNGSNDKGGTCKDYRRISFRVSENKYAYGDIYRVISQDGTKAAYRLKVRIGTELSYRTDYSFGKTKGLIDPETYSGEQFDVEAVGRFVYVFRAGKKPFMFYIDENPANTYSLVVVSDTGGGEAPTLESPSPNSAGVKVTASVSRTANKDVTDVLTAMTAPTGGQDANARMLFWGFSDVKKVSTNAGVSYLTNPNLQARNVEGSGTPVDLALKGPSDLGLWATPPQPNPSFTDYQWWVDGTRQAFTYTNPNNERQGLAWNVSTRVGTEPVGIVSDGSTVWAYELLDSRTGRRSPLSNRLETGHDGYGTTAVNETVGYNSVGQKASSATPVTFPMIQVIYNSEKYDTLRVYRGRKATTNLTADEVILSLDSEVTLATYHIDSQPVATPWRVAAYFPVLLDNVLVQQQTYLLDDTVGPDMPYSGTAYYYEGALLFGNTQQIDSAVGGLGTIRWSSLKDVSVELVPPTNRYALTTPTEEVGRFMAAGANVFAFTDLTPYLVRRETTYIKIMPMFPGFGIPNPRAVTKVGSAVYFITEHGLHRMSGNGQMEDIPVINNLIVNEWANSLDKVEMAYDAAAGVLCLLNPDEERVVCFWLNSGKVTEFLDVPFSHVSEGKVPYDPSTVSRLQQRAVFVQPVQPQGSGGRWRLFVLDYARRSGKIRTLDPGGQAMVTTIGAYTAGGTTLILNGTLGTRMEGCYLYVMNGANIGKKVKVVKKTSVAQVTIEAASFSIPSGTILGVSPVLFEWNGHALGMLTDGAVQFATDDYHSTRHVDALNAAFTDVVLPGGTLPDGALDTVHFAGLLYRGTEEEPVDTKVPVTNARQQVASVANGVSLYSAAFGDPNEDGSGRTGIQANCLFPGLRTYVPDLDFLLLEVKVDGNIRDEDAMRRRD